jgi:hypothetical protein
MKRINLLLALGAVALLALAGVAMAKGHGNDDNGHHGRHHHDHFREMSEAGTIASFDATTGRLTIALTGGETVSGLVTEGTRISCEGEDDRRADRRDHGGDDNGGREGPTCTTAALVPGAFVGEAELRFGNGTATFEEVELGHDS